MKRIKLLSLERLVELSKRIPDPRRRYGNLRHQLSDLLIIILLAVLSGSKTWIEIHDYAVAKEEWLKTFLKLPNGIPSVSSLQRFMNWVLPNGLEEVYRAWVKPYIGMVSGKQICIDGKTMRAASRQEEDSIHIVSAWIREDGISLGQLRTDIKSNEITIIPELLNTFDIRGATVTIDAMGCQRNIAKAIIKAEANYIFSVKENQPTLHEEVSEYLRWAKTNRIEKKTLSRYRKTEKGHGRITKWNVVSTQDVVWFESIKDWAGLRSFIMVERTTLKNGKESKQTHYYVSSLDVHAKAFFKFIRGHWAIENALHWTLDVEFGEDRCMIHKGNAPENLGILRKMALALLRHDTQKQASLQRKQRLASFDNQYALSLLSGIY